MKKSQELAIRSSQIKTRLNEIAGLKDDDVSDEIVGQNDALQKELRSVECRYQAALASEEEKEQAAQFETPDSEQVEKRALIEKAQVSNFVSRAMNGSSVDGAEAQVRDAFIPNAKGANLVPLEMFAALEDEKRTDAITDSQSGAGWGPTQHRTPLQRIFSHSIMDFMQMQLDTVEYGQQAYPRISTGPLPTVYAQSAAESSTEVRFTLDTLQPRRIQGSFNVTREFLATTPSSYEDAMRGDLMNALRNRFEYFLVNGGTGFVGLANVTSSTPWTSSTASFANLVRFPTASVDGVTAYNSKDVRMLVGAHTYRHAYRAYTTYDGFSAGTVWDRDSGGVRICDHITSPSSNRQYMWTFNTANQSPVHFGAVWNGVQLIRDETSLANVGQVRVTAVMLADFSVGQVGTRRFYLYGINNGA